MFLLIFPIRFKDFNAYFLSVNNKKAELYYMLA